MLFTWRELGLAGLAIAAVALLFWLPSSGLGEAFREFEMREQLLAVGIAVTIGLWFLTRLWELYAEARYARRKADLAVQAIHAEICYNVEDLENFVEEGTASRDEICAALESGKRKHVHVTDARHTFFYRESLADLRGLSSPTISSVVAFYSELERIKVQVDSVQYDSFAAISCKGRAGFVDLIWKTVEDAIELGYDAANRVSRDYHKLGLRVFARDNCAGTKTSVR